MDAPLARHGNPARELLREPKRELSTPTRLRFGPHGSIAVELELEGEDAARWFDHAHGIGGAGIELLRHRRELHGHRTARPDQVIYREWG
jgi:hypothetical protein